MKKIASLIIVVLLFSVLGVVGCVGKQKISEEDLIEKVILAVENVKTYQLDVDVAINIKGEVEGEAVEGMTMATSLSIVDIINGKRKMRVAMEKDFLETSESVEADVYLIGERRYIKIVVPGPERWVKERVPKGFWDTLNEIKNEIELLKLSEIEILGSENVSGVDCYVVKLIPNLEKLWERVMQTLGVGQTIPEIPSLDLLQEVIKSVSGKQWIAKDTYFIKKTQQKLVMLVSSENVNFPEVEEEFEVRIDFDVDEIFHSYNKPVSIELPPEAKSAIEMSIEPEIDNSTMSWKERNENLQEIRKWINGHEQDTLRTVLEAATTSTPKPTSVGSPHGCVPFGTKAYSPDGKLFACEVEPRNHGNIGIFDVSTDERIRVIDLRQHPAGDYSNNLKGLAWSPNSKRLAVMYHHEGGGHISIVDVEVGKEVKYLPISGWPHYMEFSSDGTKIIADGKVIN